MNVLGFGFRSFVLLGLSLFAVLPATTNYQLNSYGFGSGGTANATTTTYALEGASGEISGSSGSTTNYSLKPGFVESQQAHVPKISGLDNGGGSYYNKLHFVLDAQGNPSDSLYALSISTDNFVSDTRYVKSDMTVGSSLTVADYQSYVSFGGGSGSTVIGLTPSTTYYLRVKATQGKYTESAYGPISSTVTVGSNLSFTVTTGAVSLGTLLPGIVNSGSQTINITMATNAVNGGDVYISGKNSGLFSSKAGLTIPAISGDLSGVSRGYGAQITSIGATTGSFTKVSPYDGTANTVGVTDSSVRRILTTNAPLSGGTASIAIKAKSAASDTAASDYTETNTVLASGNF